MKTQAILYVAMHTCNLEHRRQEDLEVKDGLGYVSSSSESLFEDWGMLSWKSLG